MLPLIRSSTDASGLARLPALPREGFLTVEITTRELGVQRQRLIDKSSEPASRTIRLRPAARVEGRVVTETPDAVRGVAIYLETTDQENWVGGPEGSSGFAKVETAEDGTFSVPALATGTRESRCRSRKRCRSARRYPNRWWSGSRQPGRDPAGSGGSRPWPDPGQEFGEAGRGTAIHLYYGSGREGATLVSDHEGRFETYALPGDLRMQVIAMPGDFVQLGMPTSDTYKTPSDVREFTLPSIDVVPGTTIKGRLIKGKEQPVANWRLAGDSDGRLYGFGRTDASGSFTLGGVPAGFSLQGLGR